MANLLNLIHPNRLVATIKSPINGSIQIRSEFGRYRVIVNGIPQTGGIVQDILKQALNVFNQPKNFLLLGIGGGAILNEIHHRWPQCQITAIEIDPLMVKISKKYFKINQIPHLKIITQDAYQFIHETMKLRNCETNFDAILVDCYIGDQIPPQLVSPKFLHDLKSILTPNGIIIFNRLNDKKSAFATQKFITLAQTIFPQINTKPVYCNILVIAKLMIPDS